MKTLVYKENPQIKISAPEVEIADGGATYCIRQDDGEIILCGSAKQWTLIDDEENISFADRLKERLSKMSQEEIDKAFEEMGGENDESPTLDEYLAMTYNVTPSYNPSTKEWQILWSDGDFACGVFSKTKEGAIKEYEEALKTKYNKKGNEDES